MAGLAHQMVPSYPFAVMQSAASELNDELTILRGTLEMAMRATKNLNDLVALNHAMKAILRCAEKTTMLLIVSRKGHLPLAVRPLEKLLEQL